MKKAFILFSFLCLAQTNLLRAEEKSKSDYSPMAKPNIVKLNLSSLAYKNFAVQYERILGDKISVAAQLRFMPKGSMSFSEKVDDAANSDSVKISDLKTGSFAFTPEFRYYPRHAGKGFYIAPYLRFRTISMEMPVSYVDDNGQSQSVNTTGKFNSVMGGLMIGSQFNLGKMVTLDWFIIGAHFSSTKINLDVKSSAVLSANDQHDIATNIEDAKDNGVINLDKITYSINSGGGTIGGKCALIGIRGFGLNLGFKF